MRGKVKKNGRDRRSGRSFGGFSCVRSGIDKVQLQPITSTPTMGRGTGGRLGLVPPVKRKLPHGQLPFDYFAMASVCASVKKKAFVINIAS